jgi:hypothetical protein
MDEGVASKSAGGLTGQIETLMMKKLAFSAGHSAMV